MMKKDSRSPTLEWRAANDTSAGFAEGRSSGAHTVLYDLKKAVLPRSLDLMVSLKFRP